MVGKRTTDFNRADQALAESLRNNPQLQKELAIPGLLKPDGSIDVTTITNWRTAKKLTWHHHEDMKTMQLVQRAIHEPASHTGGVSYARSVIDELVRRGEIQDAAEGLSQTLIQRAKQIGVIPPDFPG